MWNEVAFHEMTGKLKKDLKKEKKERFKKRKKRNKKQNNESASSFLSVYNLNSCYN